MTSTEKSVTLMRKKDRKKFTLKIDQLSEEDQEIILDEREKELEKIEAEAKAAFEKKIPRKNKKILKFATEHTGKKVGNGECWTLADEAYKDSKASRPTNDVYVWGDELDIEKDAIYPGDILQIFPHAKKGSSQHTAIIYEVLGQKKFRLIEQNWSGKKVTIRTTTHQELLKKYKVFYYRPD